MRIANILRKVLRRLVPNNSVEKALGVDICESGVMQNAIELWHNMYKNEPPWRGGKDNVIPLNLPSAISEEICQAGTNGVQHRGNWQSDGCFHQ